MKPNGNCELFRTCVGIPSRRVGPAGSKSVYGMEGCGKKAKGKANSNKRKADDTKKDNNNRKKRKRDEM